MMSLYDFHLRVIKYLLLTQKVVLQLLRTTKSLVCYVFFIIKDEILKAAGNLKNIRFVTNKG